MSGDIVGRLRAESGPATCWSCGEWGCTNAAGQQVPVLCPCEDDGCDCALTSDDECSCSCHRWSATVRAAADEVEQLRVDRDRWQGIAAGLASVITGPLDEQQTRALAAYDEVVQHA